jgi:membrane-bound lytic murein transglycosylase B
MKKRIFLAFTFFLLASPAMAVGQADFRTFMMELQAEAASKGISADVINSALPVDGTPISDLIERSRPSNQTQNRLSFDRYQELLISNTRINNGTQNYLENQETLESIAADYGIPPEVIVALWGIESSYGTRMGHNQIIPSLITLAWGSHRKEFFRSELFHALKILEEGHTTYEDFKGSWAGAFGQCQFMPSSFTELAADGNGDGKKDIWSTKADVFASAANYLKQRGWNSGEDWGQRVVLTKFLPADFQVNSKGLSDKLSKEQWKALGVKPSRGGYSNYKGQEARLFIPNGPSGKAYLVYNNFSTIMKWNNSTSFAFAVLSLSEKIASGVDERRGS